MLTKREISDLRFALEYGEDTQTLHSALTTALAEIEAQRPVVLAALKCTGEDGHDGVTDLAVAAEEYVDKLRAKFKIWRAMSVYDNLRRIEAE